MKNKFFASLLLCASLLVLSLELYLLKLIQSADKICGEYYENIWYYLKDPFLVIPILALYVLLFMQFIY